MNDRTFCTEMTKIQEQLATLARLAGANVNGGTVDDLALRFPESSADEFIYPGSNPYKITKTVNRRLKEINVCAPAACRVTLIHNNTDVIDFFRGESGCRTFPNGIYLEDITVICEHLIPEADGGEPEAWTCRLTLS